MLSVQRQHYSCTPAHRRGFLVLSPARHCSTRTHHYDRSSHSLSRTGVRQPALNAASGTSSPPLSGLDLQDSWSASGLASSITTAQQKPSLSMRPITTHVNVLLAGSGHYLGKAPYYSTESCTNSAAAATEATVSTPSTNEVKGPCERPSDGPATDGAATDDAAAAASDVSSKPRDPHAEFLADPAAWATQLPPVLLHEAWREMVYKFQDSPAGQGSTLDPCAHVATLLSHLLQQQARDYKQLCDGRGLNKSLACGCLQHSTTACFYFLPPHGPSKLDLVAMSALSQHVALLPMLSLPEGASDDQQAEQMLKTVQQVLAEPGAHVEGLQRNNLPTLGDPGLQLPLLLRTPEKAWRQPLRLQSLVQLLGSDEVYGLLDYAWERYSGFCEAYVAAGRDLPAMNEQLQSQLLQCLPSVAALQKQLSVLKQQKTEDAEELANLEAKLEELESKQKTQAADLKEHRMLFRELAAFMQGAAKREWAVSSVQDVLVFMNSSFNPRPSEGLKKKLLEVLK